MAISPWPHGYGGLDAQSHPEEALVVASPLAIRRDGYGVGWTISGIVTPRTPRGGGSGVATRVTHTASPSPCPLSVPLQGSQIAGLSLVVSLTCSCSSNMYVVCNGQNSTGLHPAAIPPSQDNARLLEQLPPEVIRTGMTGNDGGWSSCEPTPTGGGLNGCSYEEGPWKDQSRNQSFMAANRGLDYDRCMVVAVYSGPAAAVQNSQVRTKPTVPGRVPW